MNNTPQSKNFEDWWIKRGELFPSSMKELFRIAFSDGWYRAEKAQKETTSIPSEDRLGDIHIRLLNERAKLMTYAMGFGMKSEDAVNTMAVVAIDRDIEALTQLRAAAAKQDQLVSAANDVVDCWSLDDGKLNPAAMTRFVDALRSAIVRVKN